jgi:hypothetical protein
VSTEAIGHGKGRDDSDDDEEDDDEEASFSS